MEEKKTLKEEFEPYCDHLHLGRDFNAEWCVDVAEDFAIEFHKWMMLNDTQENAEKWFHYTDKDMLNAFKEEKGL
jgi:hypothetical protein